MRGTFQFPPLKPGHLYRVRMESGQHVGSGDGYKLYLNGKPMEEVKAGVGRREGGRPRGAVVNGEFAAEFAKGPVTLAATTFLRYGDRAIVTMPPVPRGLFTLWIEEMKVPPIDDAALRKSATIIPMLSAAWQEKQDPNNKELQTADDRFHYDGKFTANPKVLGNWTTVAVVPTIDGVRSRETRRRQPRPVQGSHLQGRRPDRFGNPDLVRRHAAGSRPLPGAQDDRQDHRRQRLPLHRGRRVQQQESRGLEVAAVRHETEHRHPVTSREQA